MSDFRYVGRNVPRPDGPDKVRGRYNYLADEPLANVLYGALVLSARAHARVTALRAEKALELHGVIILTFEDAPQTRYNSGEWFPGQDDHADETILTGHARHVGDRLALILAPDEKTARAARDLVTVEYVDLPPVIGFDAAEELAKTLHDDGQAAFIGRLGYDDFDQALARAASVVTDTVTTPKIHHAALEPHAVLAWPRPENVLEIHSPCQIMFGVQHAVSRVVPLPLAKLRVIKTRMGGTFGGKQEVVYEPLVAWAAWKLGRPIFLQTSREESILGTRTRAAAQGRMTTALDNEGRILGRRVEMTVDAGAYLSGSKKVLMAMGKKLSRLYRVPALDYQGRVVRTTTTPAGACRGYGSPQIHALTEIHTDLLCARLGFDPVAFRLKNVVEPGETDPSGASNFGNARIRDCLTRGLTAFGWERRRQPSGSGRFRRGAGFACCTHGNGYYGTIYHDMAAMSLRLLEDGSAVLRAGVHELGNAPGAALIQIVAEVTGIAPERITALEGDTLANHYDIGCQASRGIYVLGECARLCAEKVLEKIRDEAETLWGPAVEWRNGALELEGRALPLGEAVRQIERKNRVSLEVTVEHRPTLNPASYGVHFVDLTVDTLTGLVHIEKYLAVHDIGQAINRRLVEGQIYGGVQMGLGMALTEELAYDDQGRPSARNFDKYHLVNAPDMPEVETILIEEGEPGGPFGAKSIGEIATVPVAPAVVNAVNRALGTDLTALPLTPARIVAHLTSRPA